VLQSDIHRNTSQPGTLSEPLFPLFLHLKNLLRHWSIGGIGLASLSHDLPSTVRGGRRFLPGVPKYISGRQNNCLVSSAVEGQETFFTEIERDMVSVVNVTTAMTDLHVGN